MPPKEKFVDYYKVLQVWPTASEDAVKKAYFKLAKLYHPDVVTKGGGEVEGSGQGVDFKLINEAYSVLSDPGRRREYDERMRREGKSDTPATREQDTRSAQLAFEQAMTAMRHNRYDKAVVLLKSAIKYDETNAAYHSWYGFALGALKTRLHEARDACKKALEMEFYNADYHANLGFVYLQAGLKSTAQECFEEALKWDPDHALAQKHLQKRAQKGNGLLQKILAFFTGGSKAPSTG